MSKASSLVKSRMSRYILRVHRWLALLLGGQVLLWILSGVVMSWFHINLVRGTTYASLPAPIELNVQIFASPGGVINQAPGAQKLELKDFLGRTVYITSGNGADHMFDAISGEKISPLSEANVRQVAERDYTGEAKIEFARFVTAAPKEYRGSFPVWQVQYRDRLKTRLYISPNNGRVLARRNNIWRLYDFFWMLHIMDYQSREDFNNPLLRAFSISSLLFVLSGILLLLIRLREGKLSHDIKRIFRQ